MVKDIRHSPYYTNRSSISALVYDFPADEPLVSGLRDMQTWYTTHGAYIDIPALRVMNAAHQVAGYIFNDPDTDAYDYDMIAAHHLGNDPRLTILALIVLATMLKRTNGDRARSCRAILLEDRADDFMQGISLYERFIEKSELYFAEENFQTDVMAQISRLTKQNEKLQHELTQTKEDMSKQHPIIHVAGNYIAEQNIDIHDNHNCPIYANGQPKEQLQHTQETELVEPQLASCMPKFFCVSQRFPEQDIRERLDAELKQATTKIDYCRGLYTLQHMGCINIDQYASDAKRADAVNSYQTKFNLSASDFCKARINK